MTSPRSIARQAKRRPVPKTVIRPARFGDFGSLLIPPGAMVVVTQLAPGIRHRRLVLPD